MNSLPSYDLQMKAADERQRLHESVTELKLRLNESLDIRSNLRQHIGLSCGISAALSLAAGYLFAGLFVRP